MQLRNTLLLLFCSILFFSLFTSPTVNALPTTKKEWDKCVEKVSKQVNIEKVGTLGIDNAINKQCGRYSPVEETASMISGIGVSPSELVRSKKWKKKFMDITKDKYPDLIDSLLLESETTTLENGWIFGYGSKPHFAGTYDAAFAINVSSGNVFVAMNENNTISEFGFDSSILENPPATIIAKVGLKNWRFDSSWENAPEPLKKWKSRLIADNNYQTAAPVEEVPTEEVKTEEVDYFSLCSNGNAIACAKLCNDGNAGACSNLGLSYANGKGIKQDYFKAAELYEKACNGGATYGCLRLGILYQLGKGVQQDNLKAVELFKKACNGGMDWGCSFLGIMYANGQGVKQDYFKAKEFYEKACNSGVAGGCLGLGVLYAKGQGVKQDYFKAKEFYEKACNAGVTEGCLNLGVLYDTGKGVKQDYSKAAELYERACDREDAHACSLLGSLYETGKGVKQDYFKAFEFYEKACDADESSGCNFLGLLYQYGKGVKQDYSKAKEFYGKACDLKDQKGCEEYARLNK